MLFHILSKNNNTLLLTIILVNIIFFKCTNVYIYLYINTSTQFFCHFSFMFVQLKAHYIFFRFHSQLHLLYSYKKVRMLTNSADGSVKIKTHS